MWNAGDRSAGVIDSNRIVRLLAIAGKWSSPARENRRDQPQASPRVRPLPRRLSLELAPTVGLVGSRLWGSLFDEGPVSAGPLGPVQWLTGPGKRDCGIDHCGPRQVLTVDGRDVAVAARVPSDADVAAVHAAARVGRGPEDD